MKRCPIGTLIFALGLSVAYAMHGQTRSTVEFSADYVGGARGAMLTGRYYSSKGRSRTELMQNGQLTKITLGDTEHKQIWDLQPKTKTASDMSKLYRVLGRYYEAIDPQNPCSTFTDYRCTRLGSETVNGRSTEKWHLANQFGASMDLWIDTKLDVEIKMQDPDGGSAELRNIKEGPQPASLFEVPADYKKVAGFGPVSEQ